MLGALTRSNSVGSGAARPPGAAALAGHARLFAGELDAQVLGWAGSAAGVRDTVLLNGVLVYDPRVMPGTGEARWRSSSWPSRASGAGPSTSTGSRWWSALPRSSTSATRVRPENCGTPTWSSAWRW
jgi:hypothetical protein